MATVAPPLSVNDQPQRCIDQLLSIINQRDTQIKLLQEHLREQLELCRLRADRAARAEANAAAAHIQLLHATRQLPPPPPPPSLSPADLAGLNALGPAERDAAWLRRVFVRGHASPPVGPYEVAGLYVDAFFWSGTAARPDAVVAAVARVFPGVELVPTECGPRFRGLARLAPAVARFTEMERAMPSVPAVQAPPPSSHATSSPASSPYPSAASIAKRREPPERTLEPTSKRVRSAHVAPAAAPAIKCEAPPDVELPAAACPPAGERPLPQLQWFGSAATQPPALRRSDVDAANRTQYAHDDPNELHVPRTFSHSALDQHPHLGPERGFALGADTWL